MTMTVAEARALARRAVELTAADEAEALVAVESSALTRFANNRINQNVAEEDALVNVRAVIGKRIGVARTNRLDDDSLHACCEAAVAAARVAPEDPYYVALPDPEPVAEADRAVAATAACTPEARAHAVARIVSASAERGLMAAGTVRTARDIICVANSHGIDVGAELTSARATVLSMGDDGSGWASWISRDINELDARALGERAVETALRSADPVALDPGTYRVVLAPEAVAEIMDFLAYLGFSAKAYQEGRSFMSNRLEDQIFAVPITIRDDALAPHAIGSTFDYEGAPKRPTLLIEDGVGIGPVTDSYWAHRTGWPNTGHALPAPNPYGPMPLNLEMAPGDASIEDLIASVERGVYVSRFHYVNVEDPVPVTLTGMTRDGTFLIENGRLTKPVKNLRFTQSIVDAFFGCEAVSRERTFVGTEQGASLVPAMLLKAFTFTGQTR